jgi:hypothetical protein
MFRSDPKPLFLTAGLEKVSAQLETTSSEKSGQAHL